MRLSVALFVLASAATCFGFVAKPDYSPGGVAVNDALVYETDTHAPLTARDGDHHHGGGAPKMVVDINELNRGHPPPPASYYTADIDGDHPEGEKRHPGLMAAHVLLLSFAFFGALPVGIALRSVRNAWHPVAVVAFWASACLGLAASSLYRKLTPDMYEGAAHGTHGWLTILLAAMLTTFDIFAGVKRTAAYLMSVYRKEQSFSCASLWRAAASDQERHSSLQTNLTKYSSVISDEPEEYHALASIPEVEDGEWANHTRQAHSRHLSESTLYEPGSPGGKRRGSDETLHDVGGAYAPRSRIQRVGNALFSTLERILVFAAFGQVIEGVIVYVGGCRANYLNSCLAHLIKGGIFWCYGLVTFARFIGAFADMGWAWNQVPNNKSYPTAEFVESAVVFTYGITNTWMERFSAQPGDPFTTKQIEHIGIAVMFWFCGFLGMAIESKLARRWLAGGAVLSSSSSALTTIEEPASYRASFNPFPALVIGITGAAMSAHHQEYVFQVQVHDLWGKLLLGFTLLRCLTYFFLWVAPIKSSLPTRPPTEALASFFLTCGGLVFMMSSEELGFAAMRRGRDDVMMFLTVAVAISCIAMSWTFIVVTFKGWLKTRSAPSPLTFRPAP